MASQTLYSEKSVLILDDLPDMRSIMRSQIGMLGCQRVAVCGTVKEALEQFKNNSFDIILCDYYLAGGTDGQQFLEYLRTRNIIGRGVLFVMVTGEKGYESVVTAAECMPDEYLLKPFTAETLKIRLDRLLEKKQRLARIDQLQDKRNWNGVITACDEIIESKDRYMVDVMRIKGNALIFAGKSDEAIAFYQQMLTIRPMPWAKLGLARAQHKHGDLEQSKETLTTLIDDSPRLMAAYDLLGQIHLAQGDTESALTILDSARTISPNSLARHRAIATVAEKKGDFDRVEEALQQVIKKTRHSPLRETEDFARLGNALTESGKPEQAVTLLEDICSAFKADANHPMLAAVEAIAHQKLGNQAKAENALSRATQGESTGLTGDVALLVAKACLANGKSAEAEGILKNVIQSNPESKALHDQISGILRAHGAHDTADSLVANSIREIIQLNNDAVKRAKSGELSVAADMLTDAAHRLPRNVQIVANASAALLCDVLSNGLNPTKLKQAQTFQQAVLDQAPNHPKLAEISQLMSQIRTKYAANTSAAKPASRT